MGVTSEYPYSRQWLVVAAATATGQEFLVRKLSWLQVINGYKLNLKDDIIILTAYPVAGYGSFTATSRIWSKMT